jgi:glutamyl/glutaminyl-tRNA synthetase
MLGRAAPPKFLHHPLIFGAGGAKLSKSARDTGIRELRVQGLTAHDVIGRAASAVGLVPAGTRLAAADVAGLFL